MCTTLTPKVALLRLKAHGTYPVQFLTGLLTKKMSITVVDAAGAEHRNVSVRGVRCEDGSGSSFLLDYYKQHDTVPAWIHFRVG